MAAHKIFLSLSESEEDVYLVESVTDLDMDWVVNQPQGVASRFVDSLDGVFRVIEDKRSGIDQNWEVSCLLETERICLFF